MKMLRHNAIRELVAASLVANKTSCVANCAAAALA